MGLFGLGFFQTQPNPIKYGFYVGNPNPTQSANRTNPTQPKKHGSGMVFRSIFLSALFIKGLKTDFVTKKKAENCY